MGKTAVITGGSRGIGMCIAKRLSKDGFDIVITDLGNPSDEDINEITNNGVTCKYYENDVQNFEECGSLLKEISKTMGGIDLLVNNAGITKDNLMIRITEEEFDKVISVNLKGAFNMLKHVSSIMLKQKRGNIVNIASVSGLMGNIGQINYAASKAGLVGMTKTAARELGSRGIVVNAVAPGYIKTKMTDVLSDETKEAFLNNIPLKRLGYPEEVADLVAFLASQSYITGQVINIDGGMVMNG